MLYKKYHRNYVSKFKKGTIILDEGFEEETGEELEEEVSTEPYIYCGKSETSNENCHWIEIVVSDEVYITREICIIDENGRFDKFMKLVII